MSRRQMELDYIRLEDRVNKVVSRIIGIYGGDREELVSEAGFAFARAYPRHDDSRGSIDKWLLFAVWKDLVSLRRAQLQQAERFVPTECDAEVFSRVVCYGAEGFIATMDGLSESARSVVSLLLGPPCATQRRMMTSMVQEGNHTRRALQKVVRQTLLDKGWSREEVTTTFRELAEAF